ncbi:MAG: hypothetical protein HUU35_11300, partial [Armatimonadetes bacterium]|nr:hypothetical protein [Armatimonadota bacterium]
ADWLLPYLGDAVVRRWLAIAARARLLERGEQEALNRRWSELLERLFEPWLAAARFEHLTWFVSFYGRWLREAGGLRGILRGVRQGSWEGVGVGAKERFEAGYGRLLKPGLRLTSLAAELRGYGWQRTAAEEYYLGRYARELEPWADELRTLHDELCRVV